MQERAAVSWAAHPVRTCCWRRHAQGRTSTVQGEASRCVTPQYPYLLPGEQQGIPCTRCHSLLHNWAKGAAQEVPSSCQGCCKTVRGAQECSRISKKPWSLEHHLNVCGRYDPQGGDWADFTDAPRSPEGSWQGDSQDVQVTEEPTVRWCTVPMGLHLLWDAQVWLVGCSKQSSEQR